MEILAEAIALKKTLLDRIRGQMGDVSKYSKDVQNHLHLAEIGVEAAAASYGSKDFKSALYHFGRCSSNIGALLALGPVEKASWTHVDET
jgi:hypothetical protein